MNGNLDSLCSEWVGCEVNLFSHPLCMHCKETCTFGECNANIHATLIDNWWIHVASQWGTINHQWSIWNVYVIKQWEGHSFIIKMRKIEPITPKKLFLKAKFKLFNLICQRELKKYHTSFHKWKNITITIPMDNLWRVEVLL